MYATKMFCFIRTTFRWVNDNNFISPKTIGHIPSYGGIFYSLISSSLPINSPKLFLSCEFEHLPHIFTHKHTQNHATASLSPGFWRSLRQFRRSCAAAFQFCSASKHPAYWPTRIDQRLVFYGFRYYWFGQYVRHSEI